VKAIRDGVIEATIDHERGYVQSKETSDVYGTLEPQQAFHQRISFCLDIHNQSVRVRSGHLGSVFAVQQRVQ
jgi:26S proteasome regulatory subunit N3